MKLLMILTMVLSASVFAEPLNSIEKEVIVTVDGKPLTFSTSGKQTISIDDKTVEIGVSYSPYKRFDNYGISFQMPAKASAYLDESTEDFDIWNIDYHESLMMLFVYKNSQLEINKAFVESQLKTMVNNMNMDIEEPTTVQYKNTDIAVLNTIGNLGKYQFMVEQFGFKNDQHSFLVFGYAPLKEKTSRTIDDVYVVFKDLLFSSLTY